MLLIKGEEGSFQMDYDLVNNLLMLMLGSAKVRKSSHELGQHRLGVLKP